MRRATVGPKRLVRTVDGSSFEPTRFALEPVGVTLGAWVRGLDLGLPLDDRLRVELETAWAEWKVLFFADQDISAANFADFVGNWGTITDDHLLMSTAEDPVDNVVTFTRDATTAGLENGWHSDGTFRRMPAAGTLLGAIEVPPVGGDTLFADMAAAFDNLPAEVKERLIGLRARHDWSLGGYADKYGDRLEALRREVPPVEHPVVIEHPRTGRATLFVNPMFTDRIVGLDDSRTADALLELLCHQITAPEVQVRLRWKPGTVAFWDNIAVQHYGVSDYHPQRRVMTRATFFAPKAWDLTPWQG